MIKIKPRRLVRKEIEEEFDAAFAKFHRLNKLRLAKEKLKSKK